MSRKKGNKKSKELKDTCFSIIRGYNFWKICSMCIRTQTPSLCARHCQCLIVKLQKKFYAEKDANATYHPRRCRWLLVPSVFQAETIRCPVSIFDHDDKRQVPAQNCLWYTAFQLSERGPATVYMYVHECNEFRQLCIGSIITLIS